MFETQDSKVGLGERKKRFTVPKTKEGGQVG